MKIKGIELSWITVSDIKKAIKFYTEVVGLKLCEFQEEFGWAELSGPEGARLGIAQASSHMDEKPGSNAVVTITVDNIDKTCHELKSKNVRLIGDILEVPGQVKMQTFRDADGNTFQMCEILDK